MTKKMEKQHSLYAPSASERWLHCPASVNLPQEEQEDTTAADEGTLAHAIAEYKIRRELDSPWMDYEDELKELRENPLYDPEMEQYTDEYFKFVLKDTGGQPYVETRVQPFLTEENLFGTCDCMIVNGDELTIVDFKYGYGKVKAKANTQLLIYSLGALEWLYANKGISPESFKHVNNVIFQPRAKNTNKVTLTVDEIYQWSKDVLIPALKVLKEDPERINQGEWCRHCKAKKACALRLNKTAEAPSLIDIGALLDYLEPIIKNLTSLYDMAAQQAIETINQGGEIDHYKVVEGTPRKSWRDKKALDNIAMAENLDIYRALSPNDAIKKLGKERFDELLGDLVKETPGKPKLVRTETEGND